MEKISFNVGNIFCEECSLALRRFIGNMEGVESIDVEEGRIAVVFDGKKITEKDLSRITRDSIEKWDISRKNREDFTQYAAGLLRKIVTLKRHQQRRNMKKGPVVLSFLYCFISVTAFAHEADHQHEANPHRHMQYTKEKNPIPVNEQSIMKGKELYGKHCLRCHGEGGKAGGILDLIKAVFIHGDSDGEIFHVITDGVKGTAMRAFKKDLTKDMRWNLVNYIKSLKG